MLSKAEIDQYRTEGYVIPAKFKLEDDILDRLRDALDVVLAGSPRFRNCSWFRGRFLRKAAC